MENKAFALLLVSALVLAGCSSQQQASPSPTVSCPSVPTSAVSPGGKCQVFPTPCDVPVGYTKVGTCEEQKTQGSPAQPQLPASPAPKYSFDVNLTFCDFVPYPDTYMVSYTLRNQNSSPVPLNSSVWLVSQDVNSYDGRSIQSAYGKGRLLWQDAQFQYNGNGYYGQLWQIRNVSRNKPVNFKLIFCTPEYSTQDLCNENNGLVLDSGSTADKCKGP